MRQRLSTILSATAVSIASAAQLVVAAELRGVLPDYSLATWGLSEGLPSDVIWAIAQDVDGYLWLGTDAGPVRFDGVRFMTPEAVGLPALAKVPVRAVCSARDGSVWFGFGGQGGVSRLRKGQVHEYGPSEGLGEGIVNMLFEHPDGSIWAGNEQGLFSFDGHRWQRSEDGVPPIPVHTAFVDSRGGFLIGTARGVFRRDSGQVTFKRADLLGDTVRSITEDRFGTIWVSDEIVGLRALPDARFPIHPIEHVRGSRLLHDRQGNLWAGTFARGLWRVRSGARPHAVSIERTTALTGFTVISLEEDREGNLWVGTAHGLNRLTPYKVTPLTDLGLVRGVEATRDGRIWVGTFDAVFRFDDASANLRRGPEHLPGPLTAMHADERGHVWVATGRSLFRFDRGRLAVVKSATNRSGEILSVSSDSLGGVWIHDLERGISRLNGDQLAPLPLPLHLRRARVTSSLTDRSDQFWFAFDNGAVGVANSRGIARFYEAPAGLDAGVYRAIYQDQSGVIWLGGTDGLSRFAEGRFATIRAPATLPVGQITAIIEDNQGCMWLAIHGSAIVRIRRSELDEAFAKPSYRPRYSVYNELDGLSGTPRWFGHRSAARASDGRLWFVGGRGVTVIDPLRLPAESATPVRVRIEGALVDDRRLETLSGSLLPARTARLEIHYGVLNLTTPLETRFRYRLEGFDTNWIDAGTRREAFYTNLPPQKYRFQVVASRDEGTWTEAATAWDFSIAPTFYQTTWFALVCVAGVIATVAGTWWLHIQQVRKRFALMLGERARLSREIHDTLLQSLVGVALQLDALANDVDTSKPPRRDAFVRMRKNVEEYIREARQSIWDLRSPKLMRTDLPAALREVGEHATAGLPVSFELTSNGTPRRCPAKVEQELLRIGQEAMMNAVRHAEATHVRVELLYNDESVVLRVMDDGHGFDPERLVAVAEGHYGLVSMRERAEEIGGRLKISTGIGRGTQVETVVPASAVL